MDISIAQDKHKNGYSLVIKNDQYEFDLFMDANKINKDILECLHNIDSMDKSRIWNYFLNTNYENQHTVCMIITKKQIDISVCFGELRINFEFPNDKYKNKFIMEFEKFV